MSIWDQWQRLAEIHLPEIIDGSNLLEHTLIADVDVIGNASVALILNDIDFLQKRYKKQHKYKFAYGKQKEYKITI